MALTAELIITLQCLKGVGAATIRKIAAVLPASEITFEDLCSRWSPIKNKKLESIDIQELHDAHKKALKIIGKSESNGIGMLSFYDEKYPELLKSCITEEGKEDPPLLLYYRGDLNILKKPAVAIIGTREPSPDGIRAGLHFSEYFAKKGFNIVSGLAIGCDTVGHQGALNVGGSTTAFLANGLDWESIYPQENLNLAKDIVDNGGLLFSEYPVGQKCGRYSLVARDRLQAGLSLATIAIQTGIHGGTMHAVNATIQAKKPLFMVRFKDYEVQGEKAQGNKKLIAEGKAIGLGSDNIEEATKLILGDKQHSNTTENKTNTKTTNPELFPNL